ncbi:GNAT family N-acetyltransferase [Cellulosilyticum sp. I15G10I2]|uniref:GNAT family N-acetyltransferase n=1 Tax=Cellulosilyticum sp. I15G10I2 TaxID=1892843 RepID=UPI00085BE672|nr:GNAT family N-acetyltransferase [Cellulosilyticum sp. I15G10I2]
MKSIVRAEPKDALILTKIAIRSEAYWGYNFQFMKKFKSVYKISEDYIEKNSTYIIIDKDIIVGFYGLLINEREISLEYLFIEPQYIGKGYGKMLWNHMISECKVLNIKEFALVTSQQAKEFYIKLGAKTCGEVDSLVIKGRKVPKLIYRVQ